MTLEENNNLCTKVTDNVNAILAYWDTDQVCRYANSGYMRWFGKTREEMVGKMTLKELLGPVYPLTMPHILGVLTGHKQTFENEIRTHDGRVINALVDYTPDIENGEIKGFFVNVADVTPLKVLEKELLRSNELVKTQNERLVKFNSIVSHDLKTYANNIENILKMLEAASTEQERRETLDLLKFVSKGFSSIVRNLNKVLEVQNRGPLTTEMISLRQYIDDTISILTIQIAKTHAVVINRVSADSKIFAIPAYIESILLNFLTNAIKYRQPGRDLVVELDSYKTENELVLSIKDNGSGIDMEQNGHKLFGMFNTFHGNADAKGVGLFITKFQVESMGGHIDVESELNVGTTFKVRFPIAE